MDDQRAGIWPTWAIAALTLAVMIAGLSITGGPSQGRAERRDDDRRSDLAALARQAQCLYRTEGRNDGNLSPTKLCPDDLRQIDPYTSQPYAIEPIDGRRLRLCAGFEEPQEAWQFGGYVESSGHCLVTTLSTAGERPGGCAPTVTDAPAKPGGDRFMSR